MKLAILSLVLVGICYVSNSCAMENLAEAKKLVTNLEIMIWEDAMTSKPENLQSMLQRSKGYFNSAHQAEISLQPIVDDNSISLPVRQKAQSYLNRALLIKKLYSSS